MKKTNKISFLGGDITTMGVLRILVQEGYDIMTYAMEEAVGMLKNDQIKIANDLNQLADHSEYIISSTSFIDSMGHLLTAFSEKRIPFSDIQKTIKNKTIITGGISDSEKEALVSSGNKVLDINETAEISVLNSVTAAEGALEIAISKTDYTINGSHVLVLGYGKLGKSVAKIFKALGANVSVEARKDIDLAWIKSNGYNPIHLKNLSLFISSAQIIVNTVPVEILSDEDYRNITKDTLVIDLTYNPSGIDKEKCVENEIRNIWPLALLSKFGSQSYSKTIREILKNKFDI